MYNVINIILNNIEKPQRSKLKGTDSKEHSYLSTGRLKRQNSLLWKLQEPKKLHLGGKMCWIYQAAYKL